jgi:succinyl-diaminopimelate desuccinylase
VRVKGVQGHVAYPDQVDNPIHAAAAVLAQFASTIWDEGNDHYPATTAQITNIHGGTGASNVVPGDVVIDFNLRFNTEQTSDGLMQRIEQMFSDVDTDIDWALSGQPFLTSDGKLIEATTAVVKKELGITPIQSTGGGTSDGRFIATLGCELLELGPVNATIHKIDENVAVEDLGPLADVYSAILEQLLTSGA